MRHKLIAYLIRMVLKGLLLTCRVKIEGLEGIREAKQTGPLIIMLWHNRLAPLAEILSPLTDKFRFAAFVSKSRDGEILSQFVLSYKGGAVIRVPHDGRDKALKVMIETLNQSDEIVLITPDGPRGPRYKMKPGVLFAAQATAAWIIPFTWESKSCFELKTWDRFRLPKPFSTIHARFGAPVKAESLNQLESS